MAMISPTSGEVVGAPGSPYRASSGTALNSAPKPSLSKELMQKLRSMTETIKMLSDENAQLRTQNEEILREKKEVMVRGGGNGNGRRPMGGSNGLYDDLDKTQLVELVLSYDEKLKALSSEVSELQVNLCQKLLFLYQLTHNMTTNCSLFMKIVSSEYLQNMLCTQIVVFVLF